MPCGSVEKVDDVYYWQSDEEYHYEPEEDDDDIWDYDEGPEPPDYREDSGIPGIGFEIEKGGDPAFCSCYSKEGLYSKTGCVMEEDATVSWELKTPIYPLFSERIENDWLPEIEKAVNAVNHDGAGGHIHLSLPPKTGEQLFDYCRPYLPLFMAMYPNRLDGEYCKVKTECRLKKDADKHQAIKIWDNRVELRFPAKVYNMKAILFRLNFCRLMIEKEYKSIFSVTMAAFDSQTKLYRLVMEEYKGRELMLLNRVLGVAKDYFNTSLLKEKSMERLLINLKNKKSCVLPS